VTREDVMSALYAKLTAGGAYKTIGRRLVLWTKVAEQPALFLRHVSDEVVPRPTGMPPKIVIECEVWLYANAGANPDISPEIAINACSTRWRCPCNRHRASTLKHSAASSRTPGSRGRSTFTRAILAARRSRLSR